MIKAAIFDWGGVLMRTVDDSGRRKWERKLGLPLYAVDQAVHGSRSWKQAQSGEISDAEYWADVANQLGLDNESLVLFRSEYFAGDRLDEVMVTFIRALRPQTSTALLSNASPDLMEMLLQLGVADAFDEIVISGLVGVQKPNPAIYDIVLDRLELAPGETVFVDDFVENIQAAQQLGMHTLHFHKDMDWQTALTEILAQGPDRPGPTGAYSFS